MRGPARFGGLALQGSACRGEDGRVGFGRWRNVDASFQQAGQLAFLGGEGVAVVHGFSPARSLSIA